MSIAIVVIVAVCLVFTILNMIMTAVLFRQLGLFVLGTSRGANDSGISIGRRVPKTELPDIRTGQPVNLHDGRGKLLFFGSTTCGECAQIYPEILDVERRYDIPVVNILFGSDVADLSQYVEKLDLKGATVFATEDIAQAYDVEVSPFAFVVDDRGIVVAKGLLNNRGRLIEMLAPIQQVEFPEETLNDIEIIAR
ncbi:methylamine dehydrogenase accessory protein MauD [Streptosporangium album]|uniref:Methylamine dehydrogenase accessory protein MauD n=1 Tax=Streptosporangium album TaxID=47479 RepID=A0A7W7WEF2_9ACTN|nr:thioredoxin-like domain-containing protein [Streptosporangium album]MBB4943319.1 methylamine dehydrogenase accessory protein MauD [Streptosporangium album]